MNLLRRTKGTYSERKNFSPSRRGLGGGFISTLRRFAKPIAAFFIINFLSSLFAPNVAYALTSGPTSPDYTSFEPVDTTDMVNLLSGDLAYNIPLLEVPGPAGGYPLSLSYHAGIMPNEDASWVGLGWTLNPGAINRSVNGFADDHKDVQHTDRFYWDGGETHVAEVGVTLGVAGVAGVSAGISIGTDTYQGFGVGGFSGLNLGIGGANSPASVGFNFGVDPWGNPHAGAGLGLNAGGQGSAVSLSGRVGVSTNFKSVSGYAGGRVSVSYGPPVGSGNVRLQQGGFSLVGASISSSGSGIKPSLSVGGGSTKISNSKKDKISTSGYSITLPLPLVHLGYRYQRYWIDQTENVITNGALNFPEGAVSGSKKITYQHLVDHDYDVYSLQDPNSEIGSEEYNNPDKARGGTLPNFDNYNVVAQGISGSMRPHIYKQNLVKRHEIKSNGEDQVIHYPWANHDPQTNNVGFRFINDFSNKFTLNGHTVPGTGSNGVYHQFSNHQSGEDGSSDFIDGVLNGASRKVKHYANSIIAGAVNAYNNEGIWPSNMVGYVETNSTGFDRSDAPSSQIGAYVITNESGVSYHFTLPAYSYDEYSYSENTSKTLTYNEYKNPQKYAYTWHLTAITGPDYIDRGGGDGSQPNGMLDEDDWGYWVEFDYGKWTDQYFWRTPGEGMEKDLDSKFKSFSEGTKEVYYLDAIKTKTHTALFVKDVREDAKSSLKYFRNLRSQHFQPWRTYRTDPLIDENKEGGYEGKNMQVMAKIRVVGPGDDQYSYLNYSCEPTKSLKLSKVLLIENESVTANKSSGNWSGFNSYTVSWTNEFSDHLRLDPYTFDQHKPDNVLDVKDINNSLTSSSLRVLDFDNDHYDLVPNTPNSSSGKLTLNGLKFLGKGGADVIPKMTFSYLKKDTAFDKNKYDMWGMYKSDYTDTGDEKKDRLVSETSASNVDAWSLDLIKTSLGSDIQLKYESDSYNKPALILNYSVHAESINHLSDTKVRIYPQETSLDLNAAFKVNEKIDGVFEIIIHKDCRSDDGSSNGLELHDASKYEVEVVHVGSNYIEIEFPSPVLAGDSDNDCIETPYLNFAALYPNGFTDQKGGGIRVKEINVQTDGKTHITAYDYFLENGQSSGVTSYEPFGYDISSGNKNIQKLLNEDLSDLISLSSEIPAPGVLYGRVKVEESVKVDGVTRKLPSYSVYEFETFDPSMVSMYNPIEGQQDTSDHPGTKDPDFDVNFTTVKFKRASLQLKDYTNRVGNLKSITVYDQQDQLISKTENVYLHDQLPVGSSTEEKFDINRTTYENMLAQRFNNQGVIHEAYLSARYVRVPGDKFDLYAVTTTREKYPSIQLGSRKTNYRTGITTESRNLAFDFYSGQVTETYEEDGYGNKIATKSIPAYRTYGSMKAYNMLTQEGETYVFTLKDDFDPDTYAYDHTDIVGSLRREAVGLVGATFQSWSHGVDIMDGNTRYNSSNAYRKHKFFVNNYPRNSQSGFRQFNDDGTFNIEIADGFIPLFEIDDDYANPSLGWEEQSRITLYDIHSHALEAKDINGNFAATKFDNNNQRVFATAANARYDEFAFSGAEDGTENVGGILYFGGGVQKGGTVVSATNDPVHTGLKSIKTTGTGQAFRYWLPQSSAGKTYRASVWANHADAQLRYKLNGGTAVIFNTNEAKKSGDWYLIEAVFNVPASFTDLEIFTRRGSGDATIYWDDFRVHPIDATMTSYVYNEWGELSHVLDANNLYTHYEYDQMGRLKSVTRETFSDGLVKLSEADIYYRSGIQSSDFYGAITTSQVDYNTTRLSIDLLEEGSGDYKVRWDINGSISNNSGLSKNITLSQTAEKEIIATVTDNKTGLSFTDYIKKTITVCDPAGTLMNTRCETNSNGCYTGIIIKRYADGYCGHYEVEEADSSCIDKNFNVPGCEL
ncbi:hypothetical protein [Ekhidna sp.]|jgi:hypothetical protein|uniref:hypothetical protein n=1 Tax=Ekhidna sp. TaxID=2608089 RepID=UPI0032EF7DB3